MSWACRGSSALQPLAAEFVTETSLPDVALLGLAPVSSRKGHYGTYSPDRSARFGLGGTAALQLLPELGLWSQWRAGGSAFGGTRARAYATHLKEDSPGIRDQSDCPDLDFLG